MKIETIHLYRKNKSARDPVRQQVSTLDSVVGWKPGVFSKLFSDGSRPEDASLAVSLCFISLFSMTHSSFLKKNSPSLNLLGQINSLHLLSFTNRRSCCLPCASSAGLEHLPVCLAQRKTKTLLHQGLVQNIWEDSEDLENKYNSHKNFAKDYLNYNWHKATLEPSLEC